MIEKIVTTLFRTIEIGTQVAAKVRGRPATDLTAGVRKPPKILDPFAPTVETQPGPPKPLGNAQVPIQVYGRATDPWTGRVLLLLKDRDISYEFTDTEASEDKTLAGRLVVETKQERDPYVYIRGEFIGGYNALSEIDRLGQLEQLIEPAEHRRTDGIRIEVNRRGPEQPPPGENS